MRGRVGVLLLLWVALAPITGPGLAGESTPAPDEPGATSPSSPASPEDEALAEALARMTDIRDIRPPVPYGLDRRWWVTVAAALIMTAAGLWWFWRQRKQDAPEGKQATPVPADEAALAGFASLADRQDLADKPFYFELSALLRTYIDARFGLETLEMTTEELLPHLRQISVDPTQRSALIDLFRFADPVKYADAPAGHDRRASDLTVAQQFVRNTRFPAEAIQATAPRNESPIPDHRSPITGHQN